MDQDDDVERLFSWLKTPDLRYREFAGEREIADAVATWPALARAAAETDTGEETPEPGPVAEPPAKPFLRSSSEPAASESAGEVPWPEATPSPPAAPEPSAPARQEPPRTVSQGGRETLFGETYRGFDESEGSASEEAPPEPAEGGDRSLNAVFARLSRPAARYREERRTTSSGPGLGPVFRRLR